MSSLGNFTFRITPQVSYTHVPGFLPKGINDPLLAPPIHIKYIALFMVNRLEVCIYRLSNVGPHFINCVVDPQNSGPNWSLCREVESSITTELSVFVVASVVASCFFVATSSLGLFLDCVATYFDDVAT